MERKTEKRRFMAMVKEDMKLAGVRLEDAEDRSKWRQMIQCGVPQRETPKEKKMMMMSGLELNVMNFR